MNNLSIKKWLLARAKMNKASKLTKFNESFWRFVYYFAIWTYGILILPEVFQTNIKKI